jgi:hypothetical protein
MPKSAQEQYIEAIDFVGKTIFASDWIGKLTDEEKELIEKYGPQPARRGGMTIKPCPPELLSKLDRALSRAQRVLPQRGAAADWLLDHGLVHADGCDLTAVASALAAHPSSEPVKKRRGRPGKIGAIALLMQRDMAVGRRTRQSIQKAYGKNLTEWYRADAKTCRNARRLALSNFS